MAVEIELYNGAYTGAQIDETLAAAETHISDADVHLSSAQATAISTALQPGALTSYPTKTDAFGAGTQITATSDAHFDLNEATTPGRMQCGLSVSQYVDNKPDVGGDYGFELEVFTNGTSSRFSQRIRFNYEALANCFFERIKYSNTAWSPWYKYVGDAFPFAKSNTDIQRSVMATNLLRQQRYALLQKGVSITPTKDGTYRLDGTCTADFNTPKIGSFADIPASLVGKTLKLTGGVSANIQLRVYTTLSGSTHPYDDSGDGVTFTLTSEMLSTPYDIRLYVKNGTDCTGVAIKPMLRLADISDNTFLPNIRTNDELYQDTARFNMSKLAGTSYIAVGDSITEYQGTTGHPHETKYFVYGYIEAIEDDFGVTCTNLGEAGHTIADDMETLLAVDYSAASIVTIAYGVNDARLDLDLGNRDDEYNSASPTFCGCLNGLIAKILGDNAYCNVIVLTPIQRDVVNDFGSFTPNTNGKTLEDFADACIAVAGYNSVPCIDLFHNSGITAATFSTMLKDGVHPNTAGYKRMYAAMRSALMNLVMPKD